MLTPDQENRAEFIGASDVAEALGLSPYQDASPVRLAMEKLGKVERKSIDPALSEWGHRLQPVILRATEDRLGERVRDTGDEKRVHPTMPFLRCRTDGITASGIIVEAKSYHGDRARKYPDENSPEELPLYDLVQVAAEMACWDAEVAYFSVLFGGREFRAYRIERDPVFEQEILTQLGAFWAKVQKGILPEPKSAADAALMYPRHQDGMIRTATPDLAAATRRLGELKSAAKGLEAEIEGLENLVKSSMGAAGVLVAPGGETLATWKASADSVSFDSKRFKAEHPEMFERYSVIRPGSRRFLVKA